MDPSAAVRGAQRSGGLLAVHAHPDDETLATGALLATWAAARRPVTVVTCTRGERGEVIGTELAHLEGDGRALAEHRSGELAAALLALGVDDQVFLDTVPGPATDGTTGPLTGDRFEDSGMAWVGTGRAGASAELPPHAFVAAHAGDAARRLARVLRSRRPDVVVTYEPDGGYGHPDHVRAHEVTVRAVELAAAEGEGGQPPHVVPVVLWAAHDESALRSAYAALAGAAVADVLTGDEARLGRPDPEGPLPSVAVPGAWIDLTVDVAPVRTRQAGGAAGPRHPGDGRARGRRRCGSRRVLRAEQRGPRAAAADGGVPVRSGVRAAGPGVVARVVGPGRHVARRRAPGSLTA
ncbi:PIG-L family deacetylase [Cellulomonas soli]